MRVTLFFSAAALIVTLCISGCHAQSSEADTQAGDDNPQAPGAGNQPGGLNPQDAANLNPLGLTGLRLQIFNNRLNGVRRRLQAIGRFIGVHLFLDQEQTATLTEGLLFAIDTALFTPPSVEVLMDSTTAAAPVDTTPPPVDTTAPANTTPPPA